MSMAWLCLPACTALLLGCFHMAAAESDVTPRLTFSYSKYNSFFTIVSKPRQLWLLCGILFKINSNGTFNAQILVSHVDNNESHDKTADRPGHCFCAFQAPEAPAGFLVQSCCMNCIMWSTVNKHKQSNTASSLSAAKPPMDKTQHKHSRVNKSSCLHLDLSSRL